MPLRGSQKSAFSQFLDRTPHTLNPTLNLNRELKCMQAYKASLGFVWAVSNSVKMLATK